MSEHVDNLNRAARLLRRIADVGPSEFEGVTLTEIVGDVLMAAHNVQTREMADVFRCVPDESAGMAEVHELHEHSKKVS